MDLHETIEQIVALNGFAVGNVLALRAQAGRAWPALDLPLLHKVMDHIIEHPEEHDQTIWASRRLDESGTPCGTKFCFAGHTVNMAMGPSERIVWHHQTWRVTGPECEPVPASADAVSVTGADGTPMLIATRAASLLGLTPQEADRLFFAANRVSQIRGIVQGLELAERCRLFRIEQRVAGAVVGR
jgi:hypothetical protein